MKTKLETEWNEVNISNLKTRGFNIHKIDRAIDTGPAHGRRDYYKIVLVTGNMTISFADESVKIDDTFLFFGNPNIPHSVVHHSKKKHGYACVFSEAFISARQRNEILQKSPTMLFRGCHVIPVTKDQAVFLTGIFEKILHINSTDYGFKDEMIRGCVELIIHEGIRSKPDENKSLEKNAASTLAHAFIEMLEKQFPIESKLMPLKLRSANDFANALSVHVNYLNRSVKAVTGKKTSEYIAERIVAEAVALLQHTNWSVADIAYALGFEYPTYFNNYFKRVIGKVPNSYRKDKSWL